MGEPGLPNADLPLGPGHFQRLAGQEGDLWDKPGPWRYQAPADAKQELDPQLEGPRVDDFSAVVSLPAR